jgi:hypothetical protein
MPGGMSYGLRITSCGTVLPGKGVRYLGNAATNQRTAVLRPTTATTRNSNTYGTRFSADLRFTPTTVSFERGEVFVSTSGSRSNMGRLGTRTEFDVRVSMSVRYTDTCCLSSRTPASGSVRTARTSRRARVFLLCHALPFSLLNISPSPPSCFAFVLAVHTRLLSSLQFRLSPKAAAQRTASGR